MQFGIQTFGKMVTSSMILAIALTLAPAVQAEQKVVGFARGRGGVAAKVAVDLQTELRALIQINKGLTNLDLDKTLDAAGRPRKAAISEGLELLKKGKRAYEELDLEEAQTKFDLALKKFEYGYGYLAETSPMVETLMYLGASWVLMGEDAKGSQYFMQAADLPGQKSMDSETFPPNIQDIFKAAAAEAMGGAKGKVSLTSTPQGAAILVDNTYMGGTPLELNTLRTGSHLIRAVKDGYRPWGGKLTVPSDKLKRFSVKLKPAAKHAAFSKHFKPLTAEVFKGPPGTATQALAAFLKVELVFVVTVEGEPESLQVVAYKCNMETGMQVNRFEETLDSTAEDYPEKRKALLEKLIAGEEGQGAADAAAILAGEVPGDTGTGTGGDTGGDTVADASDATQKDAGTDVKTEEQREKDLSASIKEDAKKAPSDDDGFNWATLPEKWWFWTAVGVVVVGAAVGTTIALVPSEDHTGSLVIGIH